MSKSLTGRSIQRVKLADFQGVTASQTATAQVPVGRAIHGVQIKPSTSGTYATVAQIKAQLGEVRFIIDGEVIIKATATFLMQLQEYYGANRGDTNTDGVLKIDFARTYMNQPGDQEVFALGTANVRNITIEVDMAATITNSNKLELFSNQAFPNFNVGNIITLRKYTQSFSATGYHEVPTLRKSATDALAAMHISLGTNPGVIADVELLVNNAIWWKQDLLGSVELLKTGGRTPQTLSYFHIDFMVTNQVLDALPFAGVDDFRLRTNFTTLPTNYDIFMETIERRG